MIHSVNSKRLVVKSLNFQPHHSTTSTASREKKVKIKFMNESQKKIPTHQQLAPFYSQLVRYFNIKKRECASAMITFFSSFTSLLVSRHKIAARDCIRKCASPEKLHLTCCHRRCLTYFICHALTSNWRTMSLLWFYFINFLSVLFFCTRKFPLFSSLSHENYVWAFSR